jgi:D-lactate dehydrogenase
MATIAIFGGKKWEQEYLKEKLSEHTLSFFEHILDAEHIPEKTDFEILSVFVDSRVDGAVLDKFTNVKMIAARSTGYDHIDIEECKKRGIVVANIPSYGENTVAEHAFALLLSLSKRIYDGYAQVREEGNFDPSDLMGFDLKDKVLGVVGTGRIGRYAIKIGQGFSMKVIAYDAFPNEKAAKEMGFEYRKTLEELLAESDVVTIHVPYMDATHHLINRDNIYKMKVGSVLVNTSRGPIVDTEALVEALAKKHLFGACLDVVEEEGAVKDEMNYLVKGKLDEEDMRIMLSNHVLIDMQNVIMTPHSAFNTKEALVRILDTTVGNIQGFLSGKPENVVDVK